MEAFMKNEVWRVELDLLEKFKSICKKYNLKYTASSGTLLGAVRHKGFIPWDDDIDVALMWPDYIKLLEVAPEECQYPYFFQSFLTEKDGEASACRLRRSDTTGCTKWESENVGLDYNKGIFIDIFPLFWVPNTTCEKEIQKEAVLFFWKCIRGHDGMLQNKRGVPNNQYQEYIPFYLSVAKTMDIKDIKWAYLNACAMIDYPTREIGATSSRIHQENLIWDAEWYLDTIELPFENTTICCPLQYERVLDKQYGNWRVPVKNGSRHEMAHLDTHTPWDLYFKK